jgi:hypothetical protein
MSEPPLIQTPVPTSTPAPTEAPKPTATPTRAPSETPTPTPKAERLPAAAIEMDGFVKASVFTRRVTELLSDDEYAGLQNE